mgnify:CR=1 FL=1
MKTVILWLLTDIAFVSMWIPETEVDVTEMAFETGSSDPNIHQTTVRYGVPLPWLVWRRSINDAAGYDESGFESFDLISFLLHAAMILAPLLMLVRSRRKKLHSVSFESNAMDES